jgi:hypothetical protein
VREKDKIIHQDIPHIGAKITIETTYFHIEAIVDSVATKE